MRGRRFALVFLICALLFVTSCVFDIGTPLKYEDAVLRYAEEYEVPAEIVFSVIYAESKFDPDAVSHQNAQGLMQLMPATYEEVCEKIGIVPLEENIRDPETNIRCGTYYLHSLYGMFGRWDLVIAAYNAGPGNVMKWLANEEYADGEGGLQKIPFPETEKYAQRVWKAVPKYRALLEDMES